MTFTIFFIGAILGFPCGYLARSWFTGRMRRQRLDRSADTAGC